MLTGISKFCARALLKKGAIEERDVNDVRFGIEVFITHIITFSSILIIGIMIDNFIETALFCFVFCHLRSFSNGFHAKTFSQCFILSNATYLFILIVQNYVSEYIILIILMLLSFVKLIYHYRGKKVYVVENKFFILYFFVSLLLKNSLILCTLLIVLVFDKGEKLCQDKKHIQIRN